MDNNDGDIFSSVGKDDFMGDIGSSETGGDVSIERSIITARGTGEGLIIRIDGRAQKSVIKDAFESFVESRKRFLAGNNVSFEWLGDIPASEFVDQLRAYAKKHNIDIAASQLKEVKKSLASSIESVITASSPAVSQLHATSPSSRGLFGGIDSFPLDEPKSSARFDRYTSKIGEGALFDEADARIIASTIRGGQKIETEHSIVVFGDVNSGAELIAGGDIIVLGTLRGVAHAGAYDETGAGRVIFALNLQPTQLRIGGVISRGSAGESGKAPEIARVDGTAIVVEPYQARAMLSRRKDL